MDGGVWERVSASFAQHSREDAWRGAVGQWITGGGKCGRTSGGTDGEGQVGGQVGGGGGGGNSGELWVT